MYVDRARTDIQFLADLLARHAVNEQGGYVALALGQHARVIGLLRALRQVRERPDCKLEWPLRVIAEAANRDPEVRAVDAPHDAVIAEEGMLCK